MLKHSLLRMLVAAALATAATCGPAAAQSFSGLYVFGDSLSDGGNNYLQFGGLFTTPSPADGTFVPTFPYVPSPGYTNLPVYSNGPVWVTSFASALGLSGYATPSLAGGGDYAYGGAKMATDGSGAPPPLPSNFPPSVLTQVTSYLSSGPASPTALYVIAGGGNDVRAVGEEVAGGAPLVPTTVAAATAYATAAATMVGGLKAAGATHIVVWTVPDVGKTPAAGSGVGLAADAASFISGAFNTALSGALTGSGVTLFDIYGLVDSFVATPAAYGFTNVTLACGYAGNGCDASSALFWDGIHPTAYAQGIVANAMLAAVPEPGSMLMLAAGLLLLIAHRRRGA